MKCVQLSEEQIDMIIKADINLSNKKLGEMLGLGATTIGKYRRKYGLSSGRGKKKGVVESKGGESKEVNSVSVEKEKRIEKRREEASEVDNWSLARKAIEMAMNIEKQDKSDNEEALENKETEAPKDKDSIDNSRVGNSEVDYNKINIIGAKETNEDTNIEWQKQRTVMLAQWRMERNNRQVVEAKKEEENIDLKEYDDRRIRRKYDDVTLDELEFKYNYSASSINKELERKGLRVRKAGSL